MKNVYLIGKNMTPQQIEDYVPERFDIVIANKQESPWEYINAPDKASVSIVEVAKAFDIDGFPTRILDLGFVTTLVNLPLNQWFEAEEIFEEHQDDNFATLIRRTK